MFYYLNNKHVTNVELTTIKLTLTDGELCGLKVNEAKPVFVEQ